jgi:hypothetical protein
MTNVLPLPATVPPVTLSEEEVSCARIAELLDMAFMDSEYDEDGDILVADGIEVPVWIHVDSKKRRIVFVTYQKVDEQSANWLHLVNEMNSNIALPQFAYRRGAVWGTYWVSFEAGLNARQFIKLLRSFAGAFVSGFQFVELQAEGGDLSDEEGNPT